jgi:hypothetical protein
LLDLINYGVTRLANVTLSVPRWQIDGQIVSTSNHATVIADITADGAIFPNVLGKLTNAQQDDWVAGVVQQLIYRRFSL